MGMTFTRQAMEDFEEDEEGLTIRSCVVNDDTFSARSKIEIGI